MAQKSKIHAKQINKNLNLLFKAPGNLANSSPSRVNAFPKETDRSFIYILLPRFSFQTLACLKRGASGLDVSTSKRDFLRSVMEERLAQHSADAAGQTHHREALCSLLH